MKITFFTTSGLYTNDGPRLLSSLLKKAGHKVRCVFLARLRPFEYESYEIEQLDEVLRDTDLVMMGVYSSFVSRAIAITEYVHQKYPWIKVIWGGPHCIGAPELSLNYADGVCFAEGDVSVVELVDKMEAGRDYTDVQNMAFRINGKRIVNGLRPKYENLDALPFCDYGMDDHYVLDGQLLPMTREMTKKYLFIPPFSRATYVILTSRGCAFNCTFCNMNKYNSMYGRGRIRFRSVDNFLAEIKYATELFGIFDSVCFYDDDFLLRPTNELEDFAKKYKKQIGLSFLINITANAYRKDKFEILLDAGLIMVLMGVQTASQRVLDNVYDRKISSAKTKEVSLHIASYRKKHDVTLILDFIFDNPFETPDDIIQSYFYILDVVYHGVQFNLFALCFYPGTAIYQKGVKEGFINDKTVYRRFTALDIYFHNNYETFLLILLLVLYRRNKLLTTPKVLLFLLGARPVRFIAKFFPESFYKNRINYIKKFIQEDWGKKARIWQEQERKSRETIHNKELVTQ